MINSDDVDRLAAILDDATSNAQPVAQLTTSTKLDIDDAYAVQRAGVALRKLRADNLVGMKMGLTSRAKTAHMGVKEPIYGHLTSRMILDDGGSVQRKHHVHPRVEPE